MNEKEMKKQIFWLAMDFECQKKDTEEKDWQEESGSLAAYRRGEYAGINKLIDRLGLRNEYEEWRKKAKLFRMRRDIENELAKEMQKPGGNPDILNAEYQTAKRFLKILGFAVEHERPIENGDLV